VDGEGPVLRYPAFKARAPYNAAICGLSSSTIIFYLILKKKLFSGKKLSNKKLVLISSTLFFSEIFLILRASERVIIITVHSFGGLGVSVMAFGTQIRGLKHVRSHRILRTK
jgi:hypothetical protein